MPLFIINKLHLTNKLTKKIINITTNLKIPIILITNYYIKHINKQLLILITIINKIYFYTNILITTTPTIKLKLQILNTIFLNILYNINILYFQNLIPKKINSTTTLYTNTSHIN